MIMKNLLLIYAAVLSGICSYATAQQSAGDTIIVKLKNKNKIIILTDKEKDFESLKKLQFDKIMRKVDSSLASLDSLFERDIEIREGRKKEVRIGNLVRILESDADDDGENKMVKIVVKDGDTVRTEIFRNKRKKEPEFHFFNFFDEDDGLFELDLGFNNYLEKGNLPSDNGASYGLLPFNSNIVNLRILKKLGGNRGKTRFSGSAGLEFSWNNYKFDQDVIIGKDSAGIRFEPFPAGQKKIKSKLAAFWINVPLMLHYHAMKSSFHMAFGGFAGYRLGSHSKVKFSEEGVEKKEKEYTNFYLNSLQYGLRFQIGFYDVDFFASYNLNSLFSKGRGPQLTPLSFGVTF